MRGPGEIHSLAKVSTSDDGSRVRYMRADECLEEVSRGVGPQWYGKPLYGATRSGIALAKEPLGKQPERYKPVDPGSVFYNPMRILLQSVAMVDDDDAGGITSPDYVVVRGRPGILHHRVFYYWLRSSEGNAFIHQLARGGVRERILFNRMCDGHIPVLPWPIQERLAKQLALIPRARAAAAERLAAAQALPAAYLREVFEGPDAKQWPTLRLGALLRRHNEIIHPGDRKGGEATFVGLEHIEPTTGRRIGSLTINLGNLTGRKPTFLRDQIVYGYLRPYLNKVWIAEFDGCSSVDQFAFDVNRQQAETAFVAAFMRSETFLRRAAIVTTTGQLPRISVDQIAAVKIGIPPRLAEQKRISAKLSLRLAEAERLAARAREELAAIDALPAALLRDAFGDIQTTAEEEEVGEAAK